MQGWPLSFFIGKINTKMINCYRPIRMAKMKRLISNTKCWQGCGGTGILRHCWWECEKIQLLSKNNLAFSYKVNQTHYSTQKIQTYVFNQDQTLFQTILVHECFSSNTPEPKTTQMSIIRWMAKQTVVYSNNRMLLAIKRNKILLH